MGRLVSETLCFTETSGQGRLSWHAILHVSFLSKLIPGLASLDLDANKSVSRKALSCCAHWRAEFTDCIHFSFSSGEVRWRGANYSEVQLGQIPCSPLASTPCRLTSPMESLAWNQAGSEQQDRAHTSDGLICWDENPDSIWITGESLSSLGWYLLINHLPVVLYCVQKHLGAVLGWRQPPHWDDAIWWQGWAKSSDSSTWELSLQLGHAALQQNSRPWGLEVL